VALLGETPAVIVKAEAEAEVGVEAGVVIGEGGGVVVLEPVTGAVEVAQWAEVGAVEGPLVVDPAVVAGVTSGSGRRTSQRSTPLSSGRRRTGWSPGSRPQTTPRPNYLFVCFLDLFRTPVFTVSFRRSWVGNSRPTRHGASQLLHYPLAQEPHL
jgi:hypothetical protein